MSSLNLAKHKANGYGDASKLLSTWSSTFGGDQPHSLQHYASLNLRKGDCRASSPEPLHARTLNKHCGERATILTQKRCVEPSIAWGACWGVSHRATLYRRTTTARGRTMFGNPPVSRVVASHLQGPCGARARPCTTTLGKASKTRLANVVGACGVIAHACNKRTCLISARIGLVRAIALPLSLSL